MFIEPMTLGLLMAGGALIGGGGAAVGSGMANKKTQGQNFGKSLSEIPAYGGALPPHIGENPATGKSWMRDVENQLNEILMRRSMGEGKVGLGEGYMSKALDRYQNARGRRQEDTEAGMLNELGGMGLSRNLAARSDTLGRYREGEDINEKDYRLGIDLEDMQARREDINRYSGLLQNQNWNQFGQEDQRANAEQQAWATRMGLASGVYGQNLNQASMYQSPVSAGTSGAIAGAGAGASAAGSFGGAGAAPSAGIQEGTGLSTGGMNDAFSSALNKKSGLLSSNMGSYYKPMSSIRI